MLIFDEAALSRVARTALGVEVEGVERMPGGASIRSYYRVRGGGRSLVVMFVPDGKPDEVTSGDVRARWPFLEVHALLGDASVRVPRVLLEACDEGLLVIEDLGDDTLAEFIAAFPERREEVYRLAVRDLARAQRALHPLPAGSVVATRAFDEKLLRWEIDHFREWGLDARGIDLSVEDRALFDGIGERLAARIAALPKAFVHRDYQSRNLMVKRDGAGLELVWIDFQDALLGPQVYDLVALLGDSYQTFSRAFIDARLDEYAEERGIAGERARVGREFDLVTVQRKLKDAGRFVFIDRVKKNPDYLPFVEPTIDKVMAALDRLGDDTDMLALRALLERVLARA